MKQDLDKLMTERRLDAIVIIGSPTTSTDFAYFAGPLAIGESLLIKKVGQAPGLVVSSMERSEAACSGLAVKTWEDFDAVRASREAKRKLDGKVRALRAVFDVVGIGGRVAFYGTADINYAHGLLNALAKDNAFEVVVEPFDSIFSEARMTKDAREIERMAAVNRRAQAVMEAVRDFLSMCSEKGGVIVDASGNPMTIGRVKELIYEETRSHRMTHTRDVIFSQGSDSAIPHSRGDDCAVLVPGKTIVFDYTPQEENGGYYADITRTWCIGYVPEPVESIYAQVLEAHTRVLEKLAAGTPCGVYDRIVNQYFDGQGHPTPMKGNAATEGYVHSVGHGLGLNIHERPMLSLFAKGHERLAAGMVFTVEPGLYYADREIGVRIEDDIAVAADGKMINLTAPLSKELLVPLRPVVSLPRAAARGTAPAAKAAGRKAAPKLLPGKGAAVKSRPKKAAAAKKVAKKKPAAPKAAKKAKRAKSPGRTRRS